MSDYNNILSVLDTINKENTFDVFIPSLKRTVKFTGITTGQQKNLLKASIDNPVFQTKFILASYDIIKENCTEGNIFENLLAIDGLAILIQLRVHVYGSVYDFNRTDGTVTMDLQKIIEKIQSVQIFDNQTVTTTPFSVTVGMPTLADQYKLELQARSNVDFTVKNINDTLGDAFIGEISKYIKKLTVKSGEQEFDTNYSNLTFQQRHAILERLPTEVVKSIIQYIEQVTAVQKDMLTLDGITVTVDSGMFAIV